MVATVAMPPLDVLRSPSSIETPIVIVGNGPSGMQCLVQLRRLGVRTPILLFGREDWAPYDRVKLSSFLAGSSSFDSLSNLPSEIDDNVVHYVGREVTSVSTDLRAVSDSTGEVHRYSTLILALGSRAYVPSTPGTKLSGVFRFRDMADAQALLARTTRSRHTIVIGGGLLGIEAARGLCRFNTYVTLIQHSERLMNRQLDVEAAEIVRYALEGEGVEVKLQTSVKAIIGDGRVEYVVLGSGEKLRCDSVVFATGIVPNRELADRAGIRIAQGVRVDQHMRTSDDNVYAIGECAQYGEHISGLVAPGLQQARVAAAHIAGKSEVYAPVADTTWLKVLSLEVFSAGEFRDEDRFRIHRSVVFRNAKKGVYRRIMLRGGRVIGMVSVGEWSQRSQVVTYLRENKRLLPWQVVRFYVTGTIASASNDDNVAGWPSSAVICQCKNLTRGTLSSALPLCSGSVIELKKLTGAGTVCGGCEPLLGNLCGNSELDNSAGLKRQVPGAKALGVIGLLSVAALAVAFSQPMPGISATVIDPSLFEIWSRDGQLRQISGYGVLVVSVLALLLSLRKRISFLSFGAFSHWRLVHSVIGLLSVAMLLWHTGFELGQNLNRWLMSSYLLVIGWGAFVAFLAVAESRFAGQWPGQWRRRSTWVHILVLWPVPLLMAFHIISAYFF